MAPSTAGDVTGLDRFRSLWQRCLVNGAADDSERIHQRLLAGYREPHRRYHTLAHVKHCLTMFDQCKDLARHPDALELAVWFHDVVWQPGETDNEALSAALYQQLSDGVHADDLRQRVDSLIMATLHDGSSLEDSDAPYMVDIDLSSFGLSWDEFLRDSQNLRQESLLEDADFYRRQGSFQNCLLSRPRFFVSEYFYQRFESQARENLARYFEYVDRLAAN